MLGQNYTSPTETASREPQCAYQLNILCKNIEELKAVVCNLSTRLERVLIPDSPQPTGVEGKEPQQKLVPLASQISANSRDIQLCTQMINSIISRTEL